MCALVGPLSTDDVLVFTLVLMAADKHDAGDTTRHARQIPSLPPWLARPDVVVYAGMSLWAIALIVTASTGIGRTSTLVTCAVGLGVGCFGTSVFLVQRRASRRGDRAAQRGLN